MSKLDAGDSSRYVSQFNWFIKKANAVLSNAGLRIQNVERQVYDVGMAVTPLNLEEFDATEQLVVEQMVEPIIMESDKVVKTGTVILRRASE
jgi:hypothetical protein